MQDDMRLRFREAMANLPAAVTILTTAGPAGRCGITASAVCSVSDDPPTLLFCINRNSTTANVFEENKRVCINVLASGDQELALHFAGVTRLSMAERFEKAVWLPHEDDLPVLEAAMVRLTGRVINASQVRSHTVMFVEIDDIAVRGDADALVYFDRKFRHIARAASTA